METERYLQILLDTLHKKEGILELILKKNKTQELLLSREPYDDEAIEEAFKDKGRLVDQLAPLDEGFENVFGRIRDDLEKNKDVYAEQIQAMQEIIRRLTDMGLRIERQEANNRNLAERYFSSKNHKVKAARSQFKAANAYKDAMNRIRR